MPRKKGQPKKLPTLTVKELQEINVQQETTKPAISKAALARFFFFFKNSVLCIFTQCGSYRQ